MKNTIVTVHIIAKKSKWALGRLDNMQLPIVRADSQDSAWVNLVAPEGSAHSSEVTNSQALQLKGC